LFFKNFIYLDRLAFLLPVVTNKKPMEKNTLPVTMLITSFISMIISKIAKSIIKIPEIIVNDEFFEKPPINNNTVKIAKPKITKNFISLKLKVIICSL